jgi:hypothetical protein
MSCLWLKSSQRGSLTRASSRGPWPRTSPAVCPFIVEAIAEHLKGLKSEQLDIGKLYIGIHQNVEVTDCTAEQRPVVSQAFCSALPVSYSRVPSCHWEPFASLVLEPAYEATVWAAVLNAQRGESNIVLLTFLGGGAFGNDDRWIQAAIRRALEMILGFNLDVKLVSYGTPSKTISRIAEDFDVRRA